MASTVIGLDIGSTHVRAVEVQQGRGAPVVLRYGEAPVPLGAVQDGEVTEPEGVIIAIRQLWAVHKFSHRDVVLGVGNQRVLVRNLDVPYMALDQVRSSLPFQVQETLPVAVEDALLDYYPSAEFAGATGRTLRGLLVAATRDTVNANVAAVEGAGLRPLMVDLNAFALIRAHAATTDPSRTCALVDIGARITNVVIVRHGQPQLVRTLPVGGQHLTDAVAGELGVSVGEAEALKRQVGVGVAVPRELYQAAEAVMHVAQGLVEAVRNTFVYFASNNPGQAAEAVVLSGGGSYLNGLGQYLSSASRLPVMMADVIGGVQVAKTARLDVVVGNESTVAVPLGLALAAVA